MQDSLWVKIKRNYYQFYFECREIWRTYILHQEDCDNCKYFGGCCCDHIDEQGNCLGWERANLNPINKWIYNYKLKKMVRKFKKTIRK